MRYQKSNRLNNVCYDIRGPVLEAAERLENQGHHIIKLNIGNPAAFQLAAPDEIIVDVIANLREGEGYSSSKGLFAARKAIFHSWQAIGLGHIDINHIWLGNGVSELISLATSALLNAGDEVLIPAPDYPLWTAAVTLTGAKARHYHCDEARRWEPDTEHLESLINDQTKALVLINPNNPTGAVYSRECLNKIAAIARKHSLVVFADEIYDRILYDGAQHIPFAEFADRFLCISFNGLSKSHRLAGFRAGWMVASGAVDDASDLLEGINMLCSMRLCSNVPAQLAIQTSLGGYQSIDDLVAPTGRLYIQRNKAYDMLSAIPGVSCVKPQAALYLFVKIDTDYYDIPKDEELVLQFLIQQHILLVQGSAFNVAANNYLRFVFLPHVEDLIVAINRFEVFLQQFKRHET